MGAPPPPPTWRGNFLSPPALPVEVKFDENRC